VSEDSTPQERLAQYARMAMELKAENEGLRRSVETYRRVIELRRERRDAISVSQGNTPEWDLQVNRGALGQQLVWDVMVEDAERVEVKTDAMAHRTGNVFVEVRQFVGGGWRPSGINVTTSDVWVFRVRDVTIAVPLPRLREAVRQFGRFTHGNSEGGVPTEGYLVPILALLAVEWESLDKAERG
jgi:hypothetical protein